MKTMRSVPAELYTEDYYLEHCGGFEEFLGGAVAPRLVRALEYGAVSKGMKVLDMGCGRGELALMCAEAGCDVWAIDYSEEALGVATEHLRKDAKPEVAKRILLHRMNAKSLALPSRFFDRVFMIDVVEHLYPEELDQAIMELRRVTRPGGRIVVHTAPNAWLIRPIYLVAGLLFRWKRHPYHVNEQSYLSLYRNLGRIGGRTRVRISKTSGFFKLGVGPKTSRSSLVGRVARLMDAIVDRPLARALICQSPLKLVLGTDLWATVEVPRDADGVEP